MALRLFFFCNLRNLRSNVNTYKQKVSEKRAADNIHCCKYRKWRVNKIVLGQLAVVLVATACMSTSVLFVLYVRT